MKAISKKLLSLLVVIAMVFSMVPFGGLSIFAVETKAAETASQSVTPGQANLPEGISTTNPVDNSDAAIDAHIAAGTCPMCNATGITWEKKENNINNPSTDVHYYYEPNTAEGSDGVYTFATNIIAQHSNANTTICVAVKSGTTLKTTNLRGVMMGSTGETLNIMGTGAFHVDTVSAGKTDYGVMQLGGGSAAAPNVVNLYGCTFTHETNQEDTSDWVAILRIQAATVTVNMYDGVVIGPETADTTQWSHNVRIDGGTLNMFGGTIQNGVSNKKGISGNVTVANGGTFNMYGGEVTGGNHLTTVTDNLGGNVLVGGYKQAASAFSAATFNMYGGSITAGKAKYGGGVYSPYSSAKVTISGGTIGGANAEDINEATEGGGIYAVGDSNVVTIQGTALLEGNSATSYGGNIHLNAATLTMEGGTVSGGYAASQGGNISGGSNSQITISGGSVYGGSFDPTGSGWGGNIRAYNTAVTISGGYIYDGCVKNATANQNAGNIGALGSSTLTISGGNIGGDIAYVNGSLTLSGAPKIKYSGLQLEDGTTAPNAEYVGLPVYSTSAIDISGLTADAEIQVTGSIGATFTASNANAADVVGCFSSTATTQEVALTDDNMQLKIIEKVAEPEVGVFAPWDFDGQAYCPVCGTLETWKERTASTGQDSQGHWYLAGDVTTDKDQTIYVNNNGTKMGCLNLNGHTLSMTGRIGMTMADTTLNIMDTSADKSGVITSSSSRESTAYNDGTIVIQKGATVNLYGGTFRNSNSSADVVHMKSDADAKLNIYQGAVIDGGARYGVNVLMGTATLYGGEITGNVQVNGSLILSGAPIIGKETTGLVLADGVLADVSGLTEGASIVVTEAEGTVISSACASEEDAARIAGYFTVDGEGLTVAANSSNQLYVASAVETPVPGDFRPWDCDGQAYCPVCGTLETWKDFNSYAYTDVKGHYYLNDHLTKGSANQPVYVSTNNTGCFNLNGYTLTIDGRIAVTAANSTLNVMDTSEGKTGAVVSTGAQKSENPLYGHTVVAQGGGSIVLHGGTFKNTDSTSSVVYVNNASSSITIGAGAKIDATGAMYGVNVNNGSVILDGGTIEGASSNTAVVRVASGKTFTMNSGTIDGKNVTRSVETVGTVTMNGGTIQNGTSAEAMGGNIYVTGGSFTMNNGFIKGGKAMNYGGNIAINAAVTVTVKDGEISGGTITGTAANCGGGNIAVRTTGATLDIQGGEIKDGTVNFDISSHAGGNIHMGKGTVKISGGTISGGKSASNTAGGSIYMTGGSLLQMTAGTITGGENTNTGGGNIGVWNGTVEIGGTAQVLDGIAKSAGGNIYICKNTSADNKLTITGGEISGGDAITNGGNIFIGATEELEMTGGTVSSGTAATNSDSYGGGNIYSDGNVTMSGGEIHSGTAVKGPGGNVVIANADMEMSGDAKIYDGTAEAHQGGNVRVYKGKLTMSDDAKIYGGHSGSSSKSHNVWIVAGDMEMSGNSYVYGKEQANGNAISIAPYGSTSATLTLKDNAKVMNDPADPVVSKGSINLGYTACNDDDLTNDMHANIVIDDSWTGEAYIMMFKSTGALNDAGTATKMAWLNIGDTVDGGDGSVNGPVGTGTSFTGNLYYTARTYYTGIIGSDSGKLVLAGHAVVDTTNDTEQWMSMEDAVAAANGNETKYLKAVDDVTLSGETVYIDALKAINVTGTGTAYGIDPANADFTTASTGSLSGEIVESDATFDGVRYIKIADGSVHAIEMGITGVSLRPTAVGLYYKATYKCDAALAEAIDAYGVVLSVEDMPGVDFTETPTDQFTVREDFSDLYAAATVANTVTANSGSVFGIMKDGKDNNQERGEMKIYANAYILVDGAAIYVGDTKNADKDVDTQGFDGVALSLYDVLKKIDDQVSAGKLELTQTNIEQITALYEKIKAWGVNWTFTNIQ